MSRAESVHGQTIHETRNGEDVNLVCNGLANGKIAVLTRSIYGSSNISRSYASVRPHFKIGKSKSLVSVEYHFQACSDLMMVSWLRCSY